MQKTKLSINRYQLKQDLRSLGISIVKGNFVKKSQVRKVLAMVPGSTDKVTLDCSFEDIVKDAHKTYAPDTYYVDFQKLPKPIQDAFEKTEPFVEESRYTVYRPVAFMRINVTTSDGANLDMEINLGDVADPDAPEEDEDTDSDIDAYQQDIANEMKATFDWDKQDVYFEVNEYPEDEKDDEKDIIITR